MGAFAENVLIATVLQEPKQEGLREKARKS